MKLVCITPIKHLKGVFEYIQVNEKISDYYVGNPSDLISMMKNLNK